MNRLLLPAFALLVGITACRRSTVEPTDTTGTLTVSAVTTGEDFDPDGYTVTVGSETQPLAVNGSVTFTDLPAGAVSVSIGGVIDNCQAAETSPVSVTIVAGQTATQTFNVTCTAVPEEMVLLAADRSGVVYTVDPTTGVETELFTPETDDGLGGTEPLGVISSMAYVPADDRVWMGLGGNSVCSRTFCIYVEDTDAASATFGQWVELGQDNQIDAAPGLAVQESTSRVFTATADAGASLWEIDRADASLTQLTGNFLNSQGQGMTFGLDGLLYIASEEELFSYDLATDDDSTIGTLTLSGFPPLVNASFTVGSLTTRGSDGTVFGILKDGGGGGTDATYLVTVDLATAVLTHVGANTNILDGLAFVPTRLVN